MRSSLFLEIRDQGSIFNGSNHCVCKCGSVQQEAPLFDCMVGVDDVVDVFLLLFSLLSPLCLRLLFISLFVGVIVLDPVVVSS